MIKKIDVRGLSCPQPVYYTKQAIDQGFNDIHVITDDTVALENIKRLGIYHGYKITIQENDSEHIVKLSRV